MAQARDPIYGTIEVDVAAGQSETFVIPGSGKYIKLGLTLPDHANTTPTSYILKGSVPGATTAGEAVGPAPLARWEGQMPGALKPAKGVTNIIDLGVPLGRDLELTVTAGGGGSLVVNISFVLFGHVQRTSTGRA